MPLLSQAMLFGSLAEQSLNRVAHPEYLRQGLTNFLQRDP
jgi:hypothetical protein